jgi:hypothetical protein
MPLPNRVDPFGAIHAVPDRGLFMGNRGGCIHTPDQTLKPRRWTSQRWIICVLDFKGRKRPLMQPGLYTELFFLDEATALAGGHRPCYECRRPDALAFRAALDKAGRVSAREPVSRVDALIAGEIQSVMKGECARETVDPATLPDGAFFTLGGDAFVKWENMARAWSFGGYGAPAPIPARAQRLTPRATCAALAAGYRPVLHPSATP